MENKHKLVLILGITSSCIFLLLLLLLLLIYFCRKRPAKDAGFTDKEANIENKETEDVTEKEDLIKFQGGEDLAVYDILDAPGEVIGKSSYGTLYRASLLTTNKVMLLRFLRPTCTGSLKEVAPFIEVLGSIRHPNLVPLCAFYAGPRGEKLLVYPFYARGNLAEFIRGNALKLELF